MDAGKGRGSEIVAQKRTPWQVNKSASDNWQTAQLAKQQNTAPAVTQKTTIIQAAPSGGSQSVTNLGGDVRGDPSNNTVYGIFGVPLVGNLSVGQMYIRNSTGQLVPFNPYIGSIPSGVINGTTGKTFVLTQTPVNGFMLYADGMRLFPTTDYTYVAATLTITCVNAPVQNIYADIF
jgi:hypothetical protein